MPKIIVYFENESPSFGEVVAHFANEDIYNACLPALEKMANDCNMFVSESYREDEDINDMSDDERAEFDYWQLHNS